MANAERPAESKKFREGAPARVKAAEERKAAKAAKTSAPSTPELDLAKKRRELETALLRGRSPRARRLYRLFSEAADLKTCKGLIGLAFAEQREDEEAAAEEEKRQAEAAATLGDAGDDGASKGKAKGIDHRKRRGYAELVERLQSVVLAEHKIATETNPEGGPAAVVVTFRPVGNLNASNLPPEE